MAFKRANRDGSPASNVPCCGPKWRKGFGNGTVDVVGLRASEVVGLGGLLRGQRVHVAWPGFVGSPVLNAPAGMRWIRSVRTALTAKWSFALRSISSRHTCRRAERGCSDLADGVRLRSVRQRRLRYRDPAVTVGGFYVQALVNGFPENRSESHMNWST